MEREGIPNEVWGKARRIWVTELESCPRQRQYRLMDVPPLEDHFMQVKGRVAHEITEQILKGEPIDPDFSSMPEAESEIILEINESIENLREWMETTDIDLDDVMTEVSIETPLRDGYVLVGKIDLLTPSIILDFKSGQRRNTQSNRTQLAAYQIMMEKYDGKTRDLRNVFLGGTKPVEIDPFDTSKTGLNSTRNRVEKLIDARIKHTEHILQGYTVPCELSFTCAFCRWRHKCRGI